MPEVLKRLQQRIVTFWKELDKSQKTRVVIIAGILAVAVIAGLFVATRTTYVPLFTNGINDQKEIGEISAILDSGSINHKSPENNNILVDKRDKNKAEQLLVEKGYPKSIDAIFNEGYVNNIQMSTTESDKRKFDKNTQERLLAAKLKMFDYIEDATVTLTIPEKPVLLLDDGQDSQSTAAIWIKPRVKLSQEQVNAIVMWISKSVENLSPQNITVVDNNMRQLTSDIEGDDSIDKANDQYDMTVKWASELERKVKKLFEGEFTSFDDMAVVANPKLNFNKQKSQSKKYEYPTEDGPAVRSQESTKIDLKNGTATGGTPGQTANPGTQNPSYQIEASGENSSYQEKRDTVNNELNETVTELESSVGDILSDQSTLAVNVKYGIKAQDVTDAEIANMKQMVSAATSIPVENIAINKFKISPPETVQTKVSDRIKEIFDTYGLFGLIVLLAIGLMIAALPKRKKKEEIPVLEPAAAAAGLVGPRFVVPEPAGEAIPEIDLEERSEVKKQIEKFVKQKPDAVAQLLRNWLSDEWDG